MIHSSPTLLVTVVIATAVLATSLVEAFVRDDSPLPTNGSTTRHGGNVPAPQRRTAALNGWFGSKADDKKESRSTGSKKSSSSSSGQGQLGLPTISTGMGRTATTLESFKASQEVGKRTAQLTAELSNLSIEGTAADGRIKAYYDGQQRPMGVKIDDALLESGVFTAEELNDAIAKALRDAYGKSLEVMEDRMQSLYADLGLPPSGKS